MAAAQSLQAFMAVLDDEAWVEKTGLLRVYLALYDRLTDDDEDVREIGAELVSKLCSKLLERGEGSSVTRSFSVPAARSKLLQFICKEWNQSLIAWTEAMRRLIPDYAPSKGNLEVINRGNGPVSIDGDSNDSHESNFIRFIPVRKVLDKAMTPDTALFVIEKQNLYVDEVEEARVWSEMLIDLKPLELTQRKTLQRLGDQFVTWTMDGLSVLTDTANKEVDGPLGWTSKPEVFTIGLRVILASRVLLCLKTWGISNEARKVCKKGLEELLAVGSKNNLHEFWITEVEDILGTCD
jgi:hypothetical protein